MMKIVCKKKSEYSTFSEVSVITRFDDDESEEDDFLSFKYTKSNVFNDSELLKNTGWYYQIKGPIVSLFKVITI